MILALSTHNPANNSRTTVNDLSCGSATFFSSTCVPLRKNADLVVYVLKIRTGRITGEVFDCVPRVNVVRLNEAAVGERARWQQSRASVFIVTHRDIPRKAGCIYHWSHRSATHTPGCFCHSHAKHHMQLQLPATRRSG